MSSETEISAELLLHAYAQGIFPMAETALSKDIYWVDPELRGVIPLDDFHIPRKLARKIRQQPFDVKVDTAFDQVIAACATSNAAQNRAETWINEQITALYSELFEAGWVHTVECWQEDKLVGGLYGVSIGGAFCGESMFHTVTDASKIALVYLVGRLKAGGYRLLDTQFITPHLAQFGAQEIPRAIYKELLEKALEVEGDYYSLSGRAGPETILQSFTQTS
ncbi:leucyl/phenylalanyl-tRNA--protein transferase [Paremcibacter congregatus]|uniref:Leucyl/phenylalanyl-tRNA--protein transferase n=1 Tax=Paremcibacter congregatus TaxID=2043170 RepID=A0A2G4YN78_9PROT|nr:leucyl/phenylalanyl-tRNA--protein transferase [Paremcibacter congregatus]PHZ83781.1 leucyl/phenylalanyl-tRNA--protein transferase [Paremcibacter congregatus]QDE27486.1 leucyl/phenylalanyl-tRNA--protein transferase [Paremcibacter congregatus]